MPLDQRVDRLERALADLAAAQARTEQALARLAEAQARTEERLDGVEAALARLAAAQARTEERLGRLEERMDRVEAALARLAEAQARSEERLGRLEEAMVQTQEAVRSLAMQVGRLSDAVGFTLEDLARELTPPYLAKHYGIDIPGLDRRFFGEGQRDGTAVVVVGEVRSRIYGRDVEAAAQTARRIATQVPGEVVAVLFGFVIHPSAREVAGRLGAILITSSGR
jgi:tetratricopeptide (TPR) repeat protein